MFCTRCGASLDEGDAFCTKCGTSVEQTDARTSLPECTEVLRDSAEPAVNECKASGNVAGGSKAGKRTALIVSGALAGVAAVVACARFCLCRRLPNLLWMILLPKNPSRRRRKTRRPREIRRQRKGLLKANHLSLW